MSRRNLVAWLLLANIAGIGLGATVLSVWVKGDAKLFRGIHPVHFEMRVPYTVQYRYDGGDTSLMTKVMYLHGPVETWADQKEDVVSLEAGYLGKQGAGSAGMCRRIIVKFQNETGWHTVGDYKSKGS